MRGEGALPWAREPPWASRRAAGEAAAGEAAAGCGGTAWWPGHAIWSTPRCWEERAQLSGRRAVVTLEQFMKFHTTHLRRNNPENASARASEASRGCTGAPAAPLSAAFPAALVALQLVHRLDAQRDHRAKGLPVVGGVARLRSQRRWQL